MHESSDSQLFRTTTGIQSRPDAFDESMFFMTFLTILVKKGYGNIIQFQINSRRENRQRDTRVIKVKVLRKVFSK